MFFELTMKNKYLIRILSGFFILIILIYIANLYHCAKLYHGYVIGDWLINFSGGFVRRGLSGYFTLKLSELSGIQAHFMVNFVQIFFYLLYMIILYFLLKGKKMDLWFIILLLSPVTLLFPVIDVAAVGRKEIILFSLFGLYLLCLQKGLQNYTFTTVAFSIALLIATLFHELVFFYIPYFLIAAFIHSAMNNRPFPYSSLFVVSGSLLAVIPLFLFGKSINGEVICADLTAKGLNSKLCSGILSGPNEYTIGYILEQARWAHYYFNYGICIVLGIIPFVFFIHSRKSKVVTVKKFLLAFLLLILFTIPLFLLAFDWGRWIHIHFMLILFTCTLLLQDKIPADPWNNERLIIPSLWKSSSAASAALNKCVFLVLCFFYLSFWQMKHFNAFAVFSMERFGNFKAEILKTVDIADDLFIQPYEFF